MGCEDDVLRIAKKLDKLISNNTSDHTTALDLLKALQDLKMSLEVLQKTRIGMTVNNLRKASSNDDVISLSKTLIKNWKKLLPSDGGSSQGSLSRQSSSASLSRTSSSQKMEEGDAGDGGDSQPASTAKDSDDEKDDQSQNGSSRVPSTGDPVRLKCRELLTGALKSGEVPENVCDPQELGALIEDAIFNEFRNTDSKYKNRVRSRVANLKDGRNPQLRQNVLIGLISPDKIACLTAEEMASDEMKNLRAKLTKESIDDHQMAKTGGTVTDLFKCGKCGKYKCTYTQVQTRSADEPMTTFVFCMECGNRWKFC